MSSLQTISCSLKLQTSFKKVGSSGGQVYKTFLYDLCFKTEDVSYEAKIKAILGSYQKFDRSFTFNLHEVFSFVEAARTRKLNESSFASVFSNSNIQSGNSRSSYLGNSLNSKTGQRLVDCLKRLKEMTPYTVENQWVENTFILEVVLEFEKGVFGITHHRSLQIPLKIVRKRP